MTAGRSGRAGLVTAVVLSAALAGCTSSRPHPTANSSIAVSPPLTSPSLSPPGLTPSTVAPTTPASTPPTTTPTTAPHPSASGGPPRSTCTSVSVRVIQGGASAGQEIESLQFTNSGTTRCVLNGFPVVTLLRHGNQIGQPSQASSQASSSLSLAPGEAAESLLHDYTQSCQAALSDQVRVTVPGMATTAIRPAQLRACIVRVDRLGPPQ